MQNTHYLFEIHNVLRFSVFLSRQSRRYNVAVVARERDVMTIRSILEYNITVYKIQLVMSQSQFES